MNSAIITAGCVLIMLTTSDFCCAEGWRGVMPLHSTCEDAKRLLGITKCDTGSYDFKDERAFIWFSEKPCADGWNVPVGTVTSIEVFPKKKLQLTDLNVDRRKLKKEEGQSAADPIRYIDENEGLIITVYRDGEVKSIAYIPAAKDNHLRYPSSPTNQSTKGGDPHSIIKFDEYANVAINDEYKRLDDFALLLQNEPNTRGFIITYAGRRARAGEAQARAKRAKNYLVSTRNIENARIVTVDGGYREELTVELFVSAKSGVAPTPSPTVCPSEVQIIKGGSARNNHGRSTRPRYE
jgi:hypothetical protein